MILTGKAKEDFIDYLWQSKFNKEDYKEYEDYINNQKESHTYADIIEWFDSLGVYVNIRVEPRNEYYGNDITYLYEIYEMYEDSHLLIKYNEYYGEYYLESRQEATRQAIIKANNIYNNKGA